MCMSIVVKNLSISFDKDTLISELNFKIKNGEVAIIIGESGAGKSTLLNVIAGLKKPDSGSIHLNGKLICDSISSLDPHKRNIGYVFQDFALFPHINAEKNIRFSENSNSKKFFDKYTTELKLKKHLNKMPNELSGGQQQRVSIARALLMRPSLILLDEPFSNLDDNNSINAQKLITRMIKELQIPCVMVTHDINKLDYLKIEKNITLI